MITDKQWNLIQPILTALAPSSVRGRPRAEDRACIEGILWILRTGAPWKDLPKEYPSPSTCWRRLKQWEDAGVWLEVWRLFLSCLDEAELIDWEETFLDGSFAPAKKGEVPSVRPRKEREPSGWFWSTARVFLWEFSSRLPLRVKSRSQKRRWKPQE